MSDTYIEFLESRLTDEDYCYKFETEKLQAEYIRLKAIEQAAKDFTINLNALLPVNNNGIENHFCNSIVCLSCPNTYQDFKQLKELLQID